MKNNKPKVSVIIPTYNRAYLLPRAIKSVLNQTFQDFELIIVDDGSNDNTKKAVEEFQKKDKRIKYIAHKVNKGGNVARNTGIKNAYGECIAFLDSDDEWLPAKLEKQLKIFASSMDPRLGLIYCKAICIDKKNKILYKKNVKLKGDVFKKILEVNSILGGGSSSLIKKEVFDSCGLFDEAEELRKGGAQEYEMWIRIAKKYTFNYTEEPLVKYYKHSDSITGETSCLNKERAHNYIFKKYLNYYIKNPTTYSSKLQYDGTRYVELGKTKRGRMAFIKSIKVNPSNLKSYLCLFLSFFGSKIYKKFMLIKVKLSL